MGGKPLSYGMATFVETPGSGLDALPALLYSSTLPYPFVMRRGMGTAFGRHTDYYRLIHRGEGDSDGVLSQDC